MGVVYDGMPYYTLNYFMINENEVACKRGDGESYVSRVSRTVAKNAIFINVKYFFANLTRNI